MTLEHSILGLSTGDHVMTLYRPWLASGPERILGSHEPETSRDGQWVRVAGLVVHQAPPTAKRRRHFVTLEDEAGLINVVVRPHVYALPADSAHRTLVDRRGSGAAEGRGDQLAGLTGCSH